MNEAEAQVANYGTHPAVAISVDQIPDLFQLRFLESIIHHVLGSLTSFEPRVASSVGIPEPTSLCHVVSVSHCVVDSKIAWKKNHVSKLCNNIGNKLCEEQGAQAMQRK